MKKRKFNLSKDSLKQLALAHGEKVAFGTGLLIFGIFVYAFFGRVTLPLDKGPDELKRRAQEAQSHMAASQWDEKRENLAITNYVKRAKRDMLLPEEYALKTPFDMPRRPQLSKRADPALLAVESMHATGGQSPFLLKVQQEARGGARGDARVEPNAGDTEVHNQRWALVTGLVPVRRQAAAYDEIFKEAIPIAEARSQSPKNDESPRDAPAYVLLPSVERAEVIDGQEGSLDWKPLDMLKIVKMQKNWSAKSPEIVNSRFVDPVYTGILGPLASDEWGDVAAHSPEIPLATVTEEEEKTKEAEEQARQREEELERIAREGAVSSERNGRTGGAPTRTTMVDPRAAQPKKIEYKLFRFLDLTVEPNKRYRYRVQLTLVNPNYSVPEKYLKSPQSRTVKYRETPWSEASPIVEIPRGEGMLVGEPKPPARPEPPDPPATLLVYTVEPETGLEADEERLVNRGTVLNFSAGVQLYNPSTKKHEEHQVVFKTNSLVLDVRGGRTFKGMVRDKILEPSEVLILDGSSRLVAHSELDEADQFASHVANLEDAAEAASPNPTRREVEPEAGSKSKQKPKPNKSGGSGDLLDSGPSKPTTTRKRGRE